jgi:hypothetical protein
MTVIQDTAIGVRPVAGHIGADITRLDIARPLTAEQVTAIRAGKPFTSTHTVVVAD